MSNSSPDCVRNFLAQFFLPCSCCSSTQPFTWTKKHCMVISWKNISVSRLANLPLGTLVCTHFSSSYINTETLSIFPYPMLTFSLPCTGHSTPYLSTFYQLSSFDGLVLPLVAEIEVVVFCWIRNGKNSQEKEEKTPGKFHHLLLVSCEKPLNLQQKPHKFGLYMFAARKKLAIGQNRIWLIDTPIYVIYLVKFKL